MMKFIARSLFYFTVASLLAWTSLLTYLFVSQALPELGLVAPAFGLVVFDLGMLAWLLVFLHVASGAGQRGVALVATALDFAGAGLMGAAEIFLGGQTLTAAPARLGAYALWGIAGWTISNVGLVLAFHLLDPAARREMALKDAQDHITDEAFRQLQARTKEIAADVAGQLSDAMTDDVLRGLLAGGPKRTILPASNGKSEKAAYLTEAAKAPKGLNQRKEV